ncbi:MAG: T9SS type A sorting domain-containing protein [Dyadobacter fermentans]
MKTCTFVLCLLFSAIASYASGPEDLSLMNAEITDLCLEAENSPSDAPVTDDPNASNGKTRGAINSWNYYVEYQADNLAAGKYLLTLRYYAEQNSTVIVSVNAGPLSQVELPASHSWNIAWKEHTIEVDLNAGFNRIFIRELPGFNVRQDKICLTKKDVSGEPVSCDFQMTPLAVGAPYELGATMALYANCSGPDCNGVTFTWSGNGISGEGSPIRPYTPSSPGTYFFDVSGSKDGCSPRGGSVMVEVIDNPDCNFSVSASVSDASPNCSEQITLSSQCSGPDCDGIRYSWAGAGLNVTAASVNTPAPPVGGMYNYTVYAAKVGCVTKSAEVMTNVSCDANPTEPFSACVEAEHSDGNGAITDDPNASNGQTRGTQQDSYSFVKYVINGVKKTGPHQVTLRYYAPQPAGISISVNNDMTVPSTGIAESGSWNVVWTEHTFTLNLKEGTNTIQITSGFGQGHVRQDRLCVTGPGGTGNTPSCDFNVEVHASTLTPACSTSVFAAASCSGFDCQSVSYQWSGQGTSSTFSSATLSLPWSNGTYTYTLTATKNACPPIVKTLDVTVTGCDNSGPFSACLESEWAAGNGPTSSDPNASNGQTKGAQNNYDYYVDYFVANVPSTGLYPVTLRYYAEPNAQVSVSVNGSVAIPALQLPPTYSWNIVWREETFYVNLPVGNNTIRIQGLPGAATRQDKLCVGNAQSNVRMGAPEAIHSPGDTPLLQAYPNPASGEFKAVFSLKTGETGAITVTDVQGKIWHTRSVGGEGTHEERITLDRAPAGIYLLQVKKPDSVEIKKILLTR